jgi:hypothetical protein
MKCFFCGSELANGDHGHNPALTAKQVEGERCCNDCNEEIVIPVRLFITTKLDQIQKRKGENQNAII